jgi:ADP-ribose pyrophosphatase YjhB (NUDIX family)
MHHHDSPAAYRFCPKCGIGLETKSLKDGEPSRLICPGCDFIFYLDPKVAACTICTLEGGIVLLKRGIEPQRGKWVFPGGFVDRGESVQVAAIRETLEEVNLRVSLTGILDVYSFPGNDVVVVVYAAQVNGGELKACDECLEVRTFPPEAIPWEDLGFESTRAALKDYIHRFYPRVRMAR